MGYTAMPSEGWLPVMVPGAPAAWAELARPVWHPAPGRAFCPGGGLCPPWLCGERQPGPDVGAGGPAGSARPIKKTRLSLAPGWTPLPRRASLTGRGIFSAAPRWPTPWESLAATGCESFYRGEVAEKIAAFSAATGGWLTREDLAAYKPQWVEPITTRYRGYDVYELPPNGHGITVLMALNILEGLEMGRDKDDPITWHHMIEALKLAFADAKTYVADPRYMRTRVEDLLSPAYAQSAGLWWAPGPWNPSRATPTAAAPSISAPPTARATWSLTSRATTGLRLWRGCARHRHRPQRRGNNFTLDENHFNCLAPAKSPTTPSSLAS